MNTVPQKSRQVPVFADVDVLVVGGGFAGFGAAITAARNGMDTLLIEQQSCLGGLATLGLVSLPYSYIEGVGHEILDGLKAQDALRVRGRFIDPEKTKRLLEHMLIDAGVRILYHTTAIDAVVTDNVIEGAIVHNKSGTQAILAKRVIDASGDGDISAYAGAPFEVGDPDHDGYNQSASLVFRVGNVDMPEYMAALKETPHLWQDAVDEAVETGDLPYRIDKRVNWVVHLPGRPDDRAELCICYPHSRNCRTTDAADLTRMVIEGRDQVAWTMDFMQKYLPGFENSWLIDSAPMLGVRDSRRIMGEYLLTGEDLVRAATFEDAICRDYHGLDIHHPTEPGHIKHLDLPPSEGAAVEEVRYKPGGYNEVPYRSLVPLRIEHLLVAGRCISCDFPGQSGTRLILTCLNMGQAAGTAAAMSIKANVTPRDLDVNKLREQLVAQGVNLYEKPRYGRGLLRTDAKLDESKFYIPAGSEILQTTEEDKRLSWEEADAAATGFTDTGGDVGTDLE